MSSISINVVNQKMYIHSPLNEFVSGSQNFVRFEFNFNEDWNGLTTFAQFVQNKIAYNLYLDENNRVFLPPEIKEGVCTLMLYGSGGKVIATTNCLTFKIAENSLIENAQSTEITQSLYDQLVSKVNEFLETTPAYIDKCIEIEIANYVENGAGFTGQKTDQGGEIFNDYNNNQANALYSTSHGNYTCADYIGQTVVGTYNSKPTTRSVFTVGNGTSDTDRKNAFNVFADGHAEVQTMGETDNSVATKQYVDSELATFDFIKVVDVLPQTGLLNRIYLVPSDEPIQQNLFDEYIWLDSGWEYITSKQVEVDLTEYYKKDQVNGLIEEIQNQMSNMTDVIYPVGCVYLTDDEQINPTDLFGGSWLRKTVIKTISGRTAISNFAAGQNVSTSVGDVSAHKFLSDSQTSFNVTPYSGAAGNIRCSAGNITSQGDYITSFDVITNRVDAIAFTVFWTITGKADFDQNGNYHWVRVE